MCDTGFGFGPLAPYELAASSGEFGLGNWRYRLELRADSGQNSWVLYQLDRSGWTDRYVFTENPQYTVDYVVGNHFVSTSPRSPFTVRPYVQRFRPDAHFVIDDLTFTAEYPDGRSQQRELLPDELPEMLARVFDIELDAADSAALRARSWPGQLRS